MKLAVWDITSQCNLRCKHCYNAKMYFEEKYSDMNHEEIVHLFEVLEKEKFTHLQLLGGEPLMSPYIEEVFELSKEKNVNLIITTNGTILTKGLLKALGNDNIEQINFSFESHMREKNDYVRGKGTFQIALNNIKEILVEKNKCRAKTQFRILLLS